ncbi:alpha/beta hydrolase [Bisgaard Taxon 10/6]|uniref:RBBP9/YdeN family alpha/beta hydrolase n=1 Tax=Exercitatus varius TaxID=67857 RepID=UPI00294AF268|nr:alpha/beta hydrolase [Exercitatus varius]MDG2948367.1 alpha/beta hydrolase [Exercitatus varius]
MQKRVFITHGYTANSQKHWFPWLKVRLENEGFSVKVFDMPEADKPNPAIWLAHHRANIPNVSPQDIFIGHSLGCIATLRFLAQQNRPVGGLILVAGFDQTLPNLPELNDFTAQQPDYAALIRRIPQRTVIASLDDNVVNPAFSEQLAANLQAKYITTQGYKHFTEHHGVTQLPLVYDEIMAFAR